MSPFFTTILDLKNISLRIKCYTWNAFLRAHDGFDRAFETAIENLPKNHKSNDFFSFYFIVYCLSSLTCIDNSRWFYRIFQDANQLAHKGNNTSCIAEENNMVKTIQEWNIMSSIVVEPSYFDANNLRNQSFRILQLWSMICFCSAGMPKRQGSYFEEEGTKSAIKGGNFLLKNIPKINIFQSINK